MRAEVYRPLTGRVSLSTPARDRRGEECWRTNRAWLTNLTPRVEREGRVWLLARVRYLDVVQAAASRFGECLVTTEHRTREVCTSSCQRAKGWDCQCSCLGKHHGGGQAMTGWRELGAGVLVETGVVTQQWLVIG